MFSRPIAKIVYHWFTDTRGEKDSEPYYHICTPEGEVSMMDARYYGSEAKLLEAFPTVAISPHADHVG
jgi:hypothetical protein